MFRRIEDFGATWDYETQATLKILRTLTDASLGRAVGPGGRTIGQLAWHVVSTLPEMMHHAGLAVAGPPENAPAPGLAEMIRLYEASAKSVAEEVSRRWTDAMLDESIPMYGESWKRGAALSALVAHQIHHRAQMTVLMRQAGLVVPGIYGPAREEWAAMNLPAPS